MLEDRVCLVRINIGRKKQEIEISNLYKVNTNSFYHYSLVHHEDEIILANTGDNSTCHTIEQPLLASQQSPSGFVSSQLLLLLAISYS